MPKHRRPSRAVCVTRVQRGFSMPPHEHVLPWEDRGDPQGGQSASRAARGRVISPRCWAERLRGVSGSPSSLHSHSRSPCDIEPKKERCSSDFVVGSTARELQRSKGAEINRLFGQVPPSPATARWPFGAEVRTSEHSSQRRVGALVLTFQNNDDDSNDAVESCLIFILSHPISVEGALVGDLARSRD